APRRALRARRGSRRATASAARAGASNWERRGERRWPSLRVLLLRLRRELRPGGEAIRYSPSAIDATLPKASEAFRRVVSISRRAFAGRAAQLPRPRRRA